MSSFLTLDQSTLFYWELSDSYLSKEGEDSSINKWASEIPSDARPALTRVTASTSSNPKSTIPPLTSGSSHSSAPSWATFANNISIISHGASKLGKGKAKPPPAMTRLSDGGLSDADETKGEERDAAMRSPPKGRKQVTNEVSCYIIITWSLLSTTSDLASCRSSPKDQWHDTGI
jgi:hypothetical protein